MLTMILIAALFHVFPIKKSLALLRLKDDKE
jgi:hypothetical protein